MWRLYGGAGLFLAGVSAFIVDFRNKPLSAFQAYDDGTRVALAKGLTPTAYDLVHVAAWAFIVAGVLLMILGLIRYSAATQR
ncbi:MAG TPA: hypothetical protein VK790_00545 [Solirubrobacteraceae bacterium]|jgi:hypothetical protein|nr:hypothetical protein [Solirubrobacteraceae bacterium]